MGSSESMHERHACCGRKREGLDEGWSVPTCAAGAKFQKRADHGYVCGIEDLRAVLQDLRPQLGRRR